MRIQSLFRLTEAFILFIFHWLLSEWRSLIDTGILTANRRIGTENNPQAV